MRSLSKLLFWVILFVVSWPVALTLLAVVALIKLAALPFRILGAVIAGVLRMLLSVVRLPFWLIEKVF